MTGGSPGSRRACWLPLARVLDELQSPFALETFSPLTGQRALAVDLDDDPGPTDAGRLARARETLRRLPCVSVALLGGTGAAARELAPAFDVVASAEDELLPVLDTVERVPVASLTLAQLLRFSAAHDVEQGLFTESLAYSILQTGPEFAAWLKARAPGKTRPPGEGPAVICRRDGDRLELTFNRPEKRNAFSAEMRDALVEGLQIAAFDSSLQVVLRGRGPAFCAGGDLDEFGTLPDPATAHAIRSTRSAGRLLAAVSDRTTAHLHGACVGAGIELPAFAGRVVATADAFFQLPELALGLLPGAGGTVSLPRRIGRQRTAWLALSGRRVDSATALEWGLVDELLDR